MSKVKAHKEVAKDATTEELDFVSRILELQEENKAKGREIEFLKNFVNDVSKDYGKSLREITGLEEANDAKIDTITDLQEEIEDKNEIIIEMHDDIWSLRDDIDEMDEEIYRLEKQVRRYQATAFTIIVLGIIAVLATFF